MKLHRYIEVICASLFCLNCFAQELQTDANRVSLFAVVPEGEIPDQAARNLETRLTRAIAANGFSDNGYAVRFVLTAKVDVTSKDVVPSTPPRISQKMDVTFMVGDVVENKVYSTCTVSLAGIGTTETKAFISAFSKVDPNQQDLQGMLHEAKEKILAFYTSHCNEIITNARSLAGMQRYDEAVFRLMSVPNVCADCYKQCQDAAVSIYKQKIDAEGITLLNEAKTVWMKQPDAAGAQEVADIICRINPKAANYGEVQSFRNKVGQKLEAAAKQEWDFKMQQYEDSRAFKQSIVDACKAIGVAFGNGQPKNVTKTIVSKWR